MKTVLVIGDLHIDDKWTIDTDETLEFISNIAFEHKVSDIVLLGDIYHRRDVLKDSTEERRFYKFLQSLSADSRNIYILVGNHDIAEGNRVLINELASSIVLPNIHIISNYTKMDRDKVGFPYDIYFMPWCGGHRNTLKQYFEGYLDILSKCPNPFVVFGHIPFAEAFLDKPSKISKNLPSIESLEVIPKYKFGIFGDIHTKQNIGKRSSYIGAIRNINFSDSGEKYVCLLHVNDDDVTAEDILLPSRNTQILELEYDDFIKFNKTKIKKFSNAMLQLRIKCKKDQYVDNDIINKRWLPIIHMLEYRCFYESKINFNNLDITDDIAMFNKYCDTLNKVVSDDIIERIKSVGKQIIEG